MHIVAPPGRVSALGQSSLACRQVRHGPEGSKRVPALGNKRRSVQDRGTAVSRGDHRKKVLSCEGEQPSNILFTCKIPPSEAGGVGRGQPDCFYGRIDAPATQKDPVRMCGCPSTRLLSMRLHRPVLQTHTLKGVLLFHREVYRWFDGKTLRWSVPHIIGSLPPGPT